MTTTSRRRPVRQPKPFALTPKATPPRESWWVRVDRAAWRAAVAAHERRWRRTETSTPPPEDLTRKRWEG